MGPNDPFGAHLSRIHVLSTEIPKADEIPFLVFFFFFFLNPFFFFKKQRSADDVCKSVLGVQSESAFENHDNDGHKSGHGHKSGRFSPRLLFILRKVMFLGASVALSFCIIGLLCKAIKKCRKPAATEEHNIEMGPVNEVDESRDLALAIERSLADAEKKVVEVPQTAAPQFVFLPPQFMPAAGAPGATPYVPMFAPQFMNYSLQEDRN